MTDVDNGEPVFVLDAHHFLRDALFDELRSDPTTYWHRPVMVRDMQTKLGDVIGRLKVAPERPGDDVIDHDLILVWGAQRRSSPARTCWGGCCGISWRWRRRKARRDRRRFQLAS